MRKPLLPYLERTRPMNITLRRPTLLVGVLAGVLALAVALVA
jgi:hypothetical protein